MKVSDQLIERLKTHPDIHTALPRNVEVTRTYINPLKIAEGAFSWCVVGADIGSSSSMTDCLIATRWIVSKRAGIISITL